MLIQEGCELKGWKRGAASSISADGSVIVGQGKIATSHMAFFSVKVSEDWLPAMFPFGWHFPHRNIALLCSLVDVTVFVMQHCSHRLA